MMSLPKYVVTIRKGACVGPVAGACLAAGRSLRSAFLSRTRIRGVRIELIQKTDFNNLFVLFIKFIVAQKIQ
ncbi:hypothetical protein OPV09_18935 [Janthinobacterium sp. TB1-E2]|uniref:Uncharacterized protein n=2 Tax=Janthinobacterium TaxID=29580 RepID=A0A5C4NWQ9_9BURK|nr:hypothetical protein [Janthinobacterium lividum]TNC78532.1 hypothetical protein FHI69_04390 [Janthinobacterium lividum]